MQKQSPRPVNFILISLLIHGLFALLLASGMLQELTRHAAPLPPPPPPSLTMLKIPPPAPPPPQISPTQFVPTEDYQQSSKVDPHTPLESDRNTALRSDQTADKNDSPLPQMAGNPQSSSFLNTPARRQQLQPESAPSTFSPTPVTPEPSTVPPPSLPATDSVTPQPATKPPELANALPVLPPRPEEKTSPALTPPALRSTPPTPQPQPPSPPQQQAQNQRSSPPPTPMSFQRERAQINGGATEEGLPSPAAKETEIGKYKAKVYRAIGSRWYINVERSMSLLNVGAIHVKFFVRANGTITNLTIADQSGNSDVLRTVSINSVRDAGPFEIFTDNMKQQLGDGYWEEITFTIY